MNDDDDAPECTMDELFQIAAGILGMADEERARADAEPTEALALRLSASEREAEALVVLAEMVALWEQKPDPVPGIPSRYLPAPEPTKLSTEALAVLQLRDIEKRFKISQSDRFTPLPGSPRSPAKRPPTGARHQSQAEVPTDGAARMRGFIHGRAATSSNAQH